MANAGATSILVAHAAAATSTAPACPYYSTLLFKSRGRRLQHHRYRRRSTMRCRAGGGDDGLLLRLPRRDVLTGLTGVAAAGLTGYPGLSSAAEPPECKEGSQVAETLVKCSDQGLPCPPTTYPVDFQKEAAVNRTRRPVHDLSHTEMKVYRKAVSLMKALPEGHPMRFDQQAAIHEAYCDGHYHQYDPANKGKPFDVHFSWIFAPWHRMYIYFYERALRALLKKDKDFAQYADGFALPYWNWDVQKGMVIPPLFRDEFVLDKEENSLYDPYRASTRLDMLVDLDYYNTIQKKDATPPTITFRDDGSQDDNKEYMAAVHKNECAVFQQMRNGDTPGTFLGGKWCTESKTDDRHPGTLESQVHTSMHVWVGRDDKHPADESCPVQHKDINGARTCKNDMGFLGSASRDPLFYSHHANVDRLWHLWAASRSSDQARFPDKEWLEASFVFYDDVDSPHPVRIRVVDVLDTANLGYKYDAEADKDLPWKKSELIKLALPQQQPPQQPQQEQNLITSMLSQFIMPAEGQAFQQVTLQKGEVVEVPDVFVPDKPWGFLRVLVIRGIEYDPSAQNKFDVAINVPKAMAAEIGPQYKEYAGSFAVVPSSKEGGKNLRGGIRLCVENVLADIKPDAGETAVNVLLVPRTEAEIKLKYAPTIEIESLS